MQNKDKDQLENLNSPNLKLVTFQSNSFLYIEIEKLLNSCCMRLDYSASEVNCRDNKLESVKN